MHRFTNEKGIMLIKAFEGFSSTPYICAAGYPTIGYGHRLSSKESRVSIDRAQAEQILQQDLYQAERGVLRYINTPLDDNQFSALVSFAFNAGVGALQRSTLRQKINYGDLDGAASEFLKWIYVGGTKLPGLFRRRIAERNLFLM